MLSNAPDMQSKHRSIRLKINIIYMWSMMNETMEDARKSDLCSVLSEYGSLSHMTIHRLEEYGKILMETDVFATDEKILFSHFNIDTMCGQLPMR